MDKILSPIKERILKYLAINGISRESFYRTTGLSASNFKGAGLKSELGGDKINRILACYPGLNPEWVMTGRGLMVNDITSQITHYPTAEENMCFNVADVSCQKKHPLDNQPPAEETRQTQNAKLAAEGNRVGEQNPPAHTPADTAHPKTHASAPQNSPAEAASAQHPNSVPIYRLDLRTDLGSFFSNPPQPAAHLSLPDMPACDGALYVYSDTMSPQLEQGDIILYKVVRAVPGEIVWNEIYLLSYTAHEAEHIILCYIRPSDEAGNILLVSQNPHIAPKKIPIASIRALAHVQVGIRYHSKA